MLITEGYRQLNRELHGSRTDYGAGAHRNAQFIVQVAQTFQLGSLLDYGCGKGTLRETLKGAIPLVEYDPAIFGKEHLPEPTDLVYCGDVLEHVELECLGEVMEDLKRVISKIGIFVVATRPSTKFLPDGRNAHLIQEPMLWWWERISSRWDVLEFHGNTGEFLVVVGRPGWRDGADQSKEAAAA